MSSSNIQGLLYRLRHSRKAMLALALLVVLALFLDAWAVYNGLVKEEPNYFDFYPRWVGVRAMMLEGVNPYSPQITQRIFEGMYSRPGHAFIYPAFIAFTIPHFYLPYPLAVTLWIVTEHLLLILSILLITHGRAHSPLFVIGAIAVTAIYPFTIMSITNANFTIYVLFFLSLAYWLWNRGQYALAGCALTQLVVKPQMTFLALLFWPLLALREKRWAFIAGFAITMSILILLPMPFMGNWLDDFFAEAANRQESALGLLLPGQPSQIAAMGLIILLWPACLLLWLRPRWQIFKRLEGYPLLKDLGYLISLTLMVTALTSPRLLNYDLSVAVFATVSGTLNLQRYESMGAKFLRGVLWGTMLVLPLLDAWLAASAPDPFQVDALFILLISGILLLALFLLPWVTRSQAIERTAAKPLRGQV